MSKTRKNYYTIYFTDDQPDKVDHVKVLQHENGICVDDDHLYQLGGHFPTKREANKARKEIIRILRLEK